MPTVEGTDPPAERSLLTADRLPSRWREVRLFASPPHAPRNRRPTDVVLLVVVAAIIAALLPLTNDPSSGFGAAVVDLLGSVQSVWMLAVDVLLVWAVLLLSAAMARGHLRLARDIVGAGLIAGVAAAGLTHVVTGDWPPFPYRLPGADGDVPSPAIGLAIAVASTSVTAPHLSRPIRYLSRWIVSIASFGALAVGLATPVGTIWAVAVGMGSGAVVHLLAGSPGGRPSLRQVASGLSRLGLDAEPTGAISTRHGVALVEATDRDGQRLLVRVYGRDAWDGQLIATVWRFLLYRDDAPTLALSRVQQVEHEAMLTLLAERRGAAVAPVIAAGSGSAGDELLVLAPTGTPLADRVPSGTVITDAVLDALWAALGGLHAAGIVHGGIEPLTVLLDEQGRPSFLDLTRARAVNDPGFQARDRAQLLVTTATAVGTERAIAALIRALPADEAVAAAAYVQTAALPKGLRDAVEASDQELDQIRDGAARAAGVELPDLPKLRRVSIGSVLTAALLLVAGWAMISALTDIGIESLVDAVREADGSLVLLAFVVGQTPRLANALAIVAASPIPLPYGRVAAMQFAITFVNLAMPATAARVAMNIRFFRRAGLSTGAAASVGALDSVVGFVAQILLIAVIVLGGLGSLEFQLDDRFDLDVVGPLLLLVAALLVVALAVVLGVPALRRRVMEIVRPALQPLDALRSPARVAQLLGANLLAELLFAGTIAIVLQAFGQDVGFADVVLINELVALFAGLMPVPGGIGVTEAALTAGFVAAGVPEEQALAAALTYRLVTYYTPPVLGFGAMRWLQRNRYL